MRFAKNQIDIIPYTVPNRSTLSIMTIYIDEDSCKGCGLCVYYCKQGVLHMSARRNRKGFNLAAVCKAEKCNFCKMCEINCPDFAIYVFKEK